MKYAAMIWAASAAIVLNLGSAQAQSTPNDAALPMVKALTMMATSVPCSDLDRSIAFYTKGLGMTLGGKVEMGPVTEAPLMFPGGGAYLILQHPKAEGTPLPTRNMLNRIGISVPDLKALQARLVAAGYQLEGNIREMPQYHVAVGMIQDPDGNRLELIERTP